MAKGYVLTEDSLRTVRESVAGTKRQLQNPTGRPYALPVDDGQAPEVYVAAVPVGGIPARSVDRPSAPSTR
jgi:hypothetical protein